MVDQNKPLVVYTESGAVYHLGSVGPGGWRDVRKDHAVLRFKRAELVELRVGSVSILHPEGQEWEKKVWETSPVTSFGNE